MTTLGPRGAASVYATTPPLMSLRFELSRAMSEVEAAQGRDVVITFLDISRAHLHSLVRREVVVISCVMSRTGCETHVQRLTRRRSQSWRTLDTEWNCSACACAAPKLQEEGVDFVVSRSQRNQIKDELGTQWIVKCRGLGPGKDMGDVSEIVILNRIVRWVARTATGRVIEMEAWHNKLDWTCRVVPLVELESDTRMHAVTRMTLAVPTCLQRGWSLCRRIDQRFSMQSLDEARLEKVFEAGSPSSCLEVRAAIFSVLHRRGQIVTTLAPEEDDGRALLR